MPTAETPVQVAYSIPKEGAIMWFDMLAIPADAPHPDNAQMFLNYLMEPEGDRGRHQLRVLCERQHGLAAVRERRRPDNSSIYPTDEVKKKLHPHASESQEFSRDLNRAWTRVRTGQ